MASAIDRIHTALAALEAAIDLRLERDSDYADADAEVAEAKSERLADVNREVSRRLVSAMETIRAVLDK
jgi:phage-related minor tail protein